MSEAAIIRSPSFSRERLSRAIMNWPFLNAVRVSSMESNSCAMVEEGILTSMTLCVEVYKQKNTPLCNGSGVVIFLLTWAL